MRRLVSVVVDDEDNPVVHWSRDATGAEPYAGGSYYLNLGDDAVLSKIGSLIVVEMNYTYTPGMISHVLETPIVFDRKSIRWPRLTSKVQLCDSDGNCTA